MFTLTIWTFYDFVYHIPHLFFTISHLTLLFKFLGTLPLKGAITMKNTNKKTIVKFAAFVIIFALICIAVNFAAGQIMNKEFLSARSIFTTAIGSVLFGYFIFFGRKKAKKNS